MLKTEYDTLADEYSNAKESYILLIDTMNLTDSQRTILKSSFSYLEDLLLNSPTAELESPKKQVKIDSCTFTYESNTDYSHRIISGQEVIDWIKKNNYEDVSILCSEDNLYVSLIDIDDPNHYRESRLNWSDNKSKYQIIDEYLDPEK